MKEPVYAFIGDGKLAAHLGTYFRSLGIEPLQWSRKSLTSAEQTLKKANIVLLAISDSAIEPFISSNPWLAGKTLVHFSGSLVSSLAHGFHPLMTFGPNLYPPSIYRSIPFIGDRPEEEFRAIFPQLPNPYFEIETSQKPFYHALCVLSGNFSVLLWQKVFQEFEERLGLPREAALPYLKQVMENLVNSPKSALTGPLQRRDLSTIEKNLKALSGDSFEPVYRSFVKANDISI